MEGIGGRALFLQDGEEQVGVVDFQVSVFGFCSLCRLAGGWDDEGPRLSLLLPLGDFPSLDLDFP